MTELLPYLIGGGALSLILAFFFRRKPPPPSIEPQIKQVEDQVREAIKEIHGESVKDTELEKDRHEKSVEQINLGLQANQELLTDPIKLNEHLKAVGDKARGKE